jgi:ubiquitin-protein ligase
VIWYFENLVRFRREREAIEALASTVDWLTFLRWHIDSSRLTLDADITVADRRFPISLHYPNHFPYSPPVVRPRGETVRWSAHQYGAGGELCLEYGPDNWHPDITGADMIMSAHRLLQGERPSPDQRGEVASRHATTVGQELRGTFTRFLVTRGLASVLNDVPERTVVSAKTIGLFHGECVVYVVPSIVLPNGDTWTEGPAPLEKIGYERDIAILRWPAALPLPGTERLTDFRAAVSAQRMSLPPVSHAILLHGTAMHGYFLYEQDDSVTEGVIVPAQPAAARLDAGHAVLASRKVAVVGCGSLGSKIATMLARSGVGKFLLVDDDILFPDNFVRHDLDWRDVGTHKAAAVAVRIQLANPHAVCEKRLQRLGGQESSGSIESLIEGFATCDLLIDATAEPSVFNYLCAAVCVAKKSLLWAEVFGGGFGGLIARHRPELEPDPASMRRAIENWCADRGRPIVRAVTDYGGGPGAPAIADDADVTAIAAHAARLAIDTLFGAEVSGFPNSVYLIGLRKGWIFDSPFETYPIDVGPPSISDSHAELTPEETEAEFIRIFRLLREHQDGDSSGPAGDQTP